MTRPADQSAPFCRSLEAVGATVVELPTIAIVDPLDGGTALADALSSGGHDRVIVTSANGARWLRAAADATGITPPPLAAVGPRTAAIARDLGLTVDTVPDRFVAEALVAVFPTKRQRILVVRPETARTVVADGLRAAGHEVDEVIAYRTTAVPAAPEPADAARRADVATFTSGLAYGGYVDAMGVPTQPVVASIGPVTSDTIRASGRSVEVEAQPHTTDALVAALVGYRRT